jgi:hypothetical protein
VDGETTRTASRQNSDNTIEQIKQCKACKQQRTHCGRYMHSHHRSSALAHTGSGQRPAAIDTAAQISAANTTRGFANLRENHRNAQLLAYKAL